MLNSKGHHPVGPRRRSSELAEWSCVAGLKLRCTGRETCCLYVCHVFAHCIL